MVKWTTLDPSLVLSESNSKHSTNFKFLWRKQIVDIEKIYWSTKSKIFLWQKNSKESWYILEDGASVVQVGGIEQANVWHLFIIKLKYINWWFSINVVMMPYSV